MEQTRCSRRGGRRGVPVPAEEGVSEGGAWAAGDPESGYMEASRGTDVRGSTARVDGGNVDGSQLRRESLGFDPGGQALHTCLCTLATREHRQTRTHAGTGACSTKPTAHDSRIVCVPRSPTWGFRRPGPAFLLQSTRAPWKSPRPQPQPQARQSFRACPSFPSSRSPSALPPNPACLLQHFPPPGGPQDHRVSPLASATSQKPLRALGHTEPRPPHTGAHFSHSSVTLGAVHTLTGVHIHTSSHTRTHMFSHTHSHTRFCTTRLPTRHFLSGSDPTLLCPHCHDAQARRNPGWSVRGPEPSPQVHLLPPSRSGHSL